MKKNKSFEIDKFLIDVFEPSDKILSKQEYPPINLIFLIKEMVEYSIEKLSPKFLSDTKNKTEEYCAILSDFYVDMLVSSTFIVIKNYSHSADNTGLLVHHSEISKLKTHFREILISKFQYSLLTEIFIENFILVHIQSIINAVHTKTTILEFKNKLKQSQKKLSETINKIPSLNLKSNKK